MRQTRGHRAFRDAHDRGCAAIVEAELQAEQNDDALLNRQAVQRRRQIEVRHRELGGVVRRRLRFRVRPLRVAGPLAQKVDRGRVGDAVEPRAKRGSALEALKRAQGAQGAFLKRILDKVDVTQHTVGEQAQPGLVGQEQPGEGGPIPGARRGQQTDLVFYRVRLSSPPTLTRIADRSGKEVLLSD